MSKNRLSHTADLGRHSHDVSAGYTSTLAPGMIVPQYFDILSPGDSVYYRTHMFARMQDMVTAFLGEVDLHIDYFFVPLQMLYTPFGQLFAQTDDYLSSLYSTLSGDYFPLLGISPQAVDTVQALPNNSVKFECFGKSVARLLDALDDNPLHILNDKFTTEEHQQTPADVDFQLLERPNTSPWLYAAYQAIYQKYYRNDEFERLKVSAYNFDINYTLASFNNNDFFRLRYVQRPSDYYTKVRVSPIASAVNAIGTSQNPYPVNGAVLPTEIAKVDSFLDSSHDDYYQSFDKRLGISSSRVSFDSVSITQESYTGASGDAQLINAANIRALFAVDKFARIYGMADKTYDDQILAHFGIKIPHDVKHDLTHLKHYRLVIQADPIYGTANIPNGDGSQLLSTIGQVGGNGQGTIDTDGEKFTAPVHGVFMAVAYVVTKPRYLNTFSKLHLLKDRLSFPIPEFDKLGAQPLYAFEVNPTYLQQKEMAVRIGWQNRYQQFKERYDRASLTYLSDFNKHAPTSENIYSSWVLARAAFGIGDGYDIVPTETSHLLHAFYLFENPYNLNNVMVNPYNGDWNEIYYQQPHLMFQTDPFITEFKCFCKKVSWMSETGEPEL